MKKLIAFLLVIVLSVPCTLVYGETQTNDNFDNYAVSKEFFDKVFPELNIPSDGDFSRGEFVNAVVNIMADYIPSNYSGGYMDVDSANKFGGAIAFAEGGGLISKASLFYPDAKIRFNQAIKIAVCAAGYEVQANTRGGYPEGYIYCASNIGMLDGLTLGGEDFLSYRDGLKLLYNMATVDMLFESSFGDRVTYSTQDGVNILSKYKGIIKAEGKVIGNQYTFVNDYAEACKKSFISIDGQLHKSDEYQNLLGQNIIYFYKDTKNKEILYAKAYDNNVVEFSCNDSLTFENGSIVCYNKENKENNYKLDGVYNLILNGKSGKNQNIASYLSDENAKITIVDNNDDRKYDVVFVDIINYGVASNIINTERKLSDKYKSGYILDLSDSNISLNVYLPDGTLGEFGSINNDDVIGVSFSEDNMLCTIRIYENYVKGTVEGKDGNKMYIAGNEYILSSYYQTYNPTISFEEECIYFLGEENVIVNVLRKASDAMYGYFVDVAKEQGLGDKFLVKIYDEKGNMGVYELSGRIKYNGSTYEGKNVVPLLEELREIDPKYKVIKFKLSGENKVQKILTAEDASLLNDIPYVSEYETRPMLYYTGTTNYNKGVFSPVFHAKGSTVFMNVPSIYSLDSYYRLLTESYYYSVTPTISVYDLDVGAGAGFVLQVSTVSTGSGGGGSVAVGTINDSTASAVVERVYTTVNEEGAQVPGIQIYNGTKHLKYMAAEIDEVVSVFKNIGPGDLVRFSTDRNNAINKIVIDFSYSTKTVNHDGPEAYHPAWVPGDSNGWKMEFVAGKIYSSDDVFCIVVPEDVDVTGDIAVSGNICISLGTSFAFAEVIRNRDGSVNRVSVSQKPSSYIESYRGTGNENSLIVSRQYYREPKFSVIYTEAK